MKRVLILIAVAAAAGSLNAASGATRSGCIVPRLYTLTIPAATQRVAASGCTLGRISYEQPRTRIAKVTAQVPLPGARLPATGHVALLVS